MYFGYPINNPSIQRSGTWQINNSALTGPVISSPSGSLTICDPCGAGGYSWASGLLSIYDLCRVGGPVGFRQRKATPAGAGYLFASGVQPCSSTLAPSGPDFANRYASKAAAGPVGAELSIGCPAICFHWHTCGLWQINNSALTGPVISSPSGSLTICDPCGAGGYSWASCLLSIYDLCGVGNLRTSGME